MGRPTPGPWVVEASTYPYDDTCSIEGPEKRVAVAATINKARGGK